ncbi:nucleotide-binding protein [Fibrella sp. HMF5335]|uniref:Nucleotide-binding protein n=1 Tax=Fibrella rubiginis TaxID=2817060 RepID=A0A939K7B8_9BACT|nr:nucleotide-binding protein [Fibrella rubiginis]MBO0939773.1 nucleotide-binding protein [Fibrella rubiginis]
MDKESIALAKTAALKATFESFVASSRTSFRWSEIWPQLDMYKSVISELKQLNSGLFSDIPLVSIPASQKDYNGDDVCYTNNLIPFVASLGYILDVNSHVRIGEKQMELSKPKRIFITHGRSKEWYKIQTFLERTMDIPTLELAQEANQGRTVLQKLDEESNKCSIAVIVMTGDDIDADGTVKARENVMHEIGFFQGKYGLGNVVLLHESGVNIPSNIQGLVYISFPKDTAEAAEGAIARELKVILPNR